MADNSFMDKISSLPKWVLVTGGVLLVGLLGYGIFYLTFGMNKKPEVVDTSTITLDMPDAADSGYDQSRLEMYREGDYSARTSQNTVDDYWNSLGGDLVSSGAEVESGEDMSFLDNGEYTDIEKQSIIKGLKTREEIDAEHARRKAFEQYIGTQPDGRQSGGSSYSSSKPLTQEQKDSIYFSRMEKAYEMAMKYQTGVDGSNVQTETTTEQEKEEESKITVEEPKVIPMDSFGGDDIISSLDSPADNGTVSYAGGTARRPVKATFLKNEKISSGERVIMRLMEDLSLSDGTVIPANTHITGTCNFSNRLKIKVTMLHYGGRMFATDLRIYDNDGTEGIYCPLAEASEKKNKKAKDIASGAVSAAGSLAGTLLTGNPLIGRVATSSMSTVTSSINSDGTISINVSAGYEFYVFENIKEDKNGTR